MARDASKKTAIPSVFKALSAEFLRSAFRRDAGWRSRRDSNPRYAFGAYNGLANRRLQPLGHSSACGKAYAVGISASNPTLQSGRQNCT